MMNKTEFLAALRHELGFLPKDELDDAIRYYDEYINDAGDDEEKVIAEMGTPHKVAEEFKNEYYDRKTVNDESAKHNNQISWKTVLVCILAVGFGVPVLNMIRNALPGITGIVILVGNSIAYKISRQQDQSTNCCFKCNSSNLLRY